jgi:EPS-associated MarR family transcriptional regulator
LASRREQQRAEIRLKVMRLIFQDSEMSSRQLADEVGISNGSAYYVLAALVEKGFVKLGNFKNNTRKGQYAHLLTPKGIREKSALTQRFIERKRQEFKDLDVEIYALEEEAGLAIDSIMAPEKKKNSNAGSHLL